MLSLSSPFILPTPSPLPVAHNGEEALAIIIAYVLGIGGSGWVLILIAIKAAKWWDERS